MIKIVCAKIISKYVSFNAQDLLTRENDTVEITFTPTSEGIVIKAGEYGVAFLIDGRIMSKTIEYIEYIMHNKSDSGLLQIIHDQAVPEPEGN